MCHTASWSPVLECMTVQANPPTQYRLNVAQGFLVEARQNLAAGQWRACIDLCRTLPAYSLSTDPDFPDPVQDRMGYALYVAQRGGKHPDAKALSGFGGAGVLEVVRDFRGDAFRAVYTVRFADVVFVLHAFQKKSTTGRQTPRREIALIRQRLRDAEEIAKGAKR